jgi:hypothetical protein
VTTNNSGNPAVQLINDGKPGVLSSLNELLYLPFFPAVKVKMYRRNSISWRVLKNWFPAIELAAFFLGLILVTFWTMGFFVELLIIS